MEVRDELRLDWLDVREYLLRTRAGATVPVEAVWASSAGFTGRGASLSEAVEKVEGEMGVDGLCGAVAIYSIGGAAGESARERCLAHS